MTKSELNKKTSEFLVTTEVKGKKWEELLTLAEKHLLEKVQVKGFRKGKVPQDIARKHVSEAEIFTHAITHALDDAAKEANKEIGELMVLDAPSYNVKSVDKGKAVIQFIYPVYPEIKLSDYKNLGIKYEEKTDTKEAVAAEKKRLEEMSTKLVEKTGAIAKGDSAVFDFEGFVDGKPFDGGKAEKYTLEIGSGQFIPGFEDQMVGLKVGDEKDVNVTFPKEYHSEELKGKPAVFKVKIHEIKSKEAGKLDDALVATMNIPNVKTVAELDKYLAEVFAMQQKQEARGKFQREAFDKILSETKFVIPAQLIVKEMQGVAKQMEENLKKQGFSLEQYIKMTGMKQEQLNKQFKAQAEARLNDALVFAEIAKQEKIELKEADYEAEYVKLAKVYNQTVDGIKGSITKQQMQIPMTNDRVIDLLIKENK